MHSGFIVNHPADFDYAVHLKKHVDVWQQGQLIGSGVIDRISDRFVCVMMGTEWIKMQFAELVHICRIGWLPFAEARHVRRKCPSIRRLKRKPKSGIVRQRQPFYVVAVGVGFAVRS